MGNRVEKRAEGEDAVWVESCEFRIARGCTAHLELALAAEAAGWDGFFIYDDINMPGFRAHADPWITLGVIASRTERLKLGTSVTPIARRRPTKLAREILTLDALSGGRFIFGAGNGMISE